MNKLGWFALGLMFIAVLGGTGLVMKARTLVHEREVALETLRKDAEASSSANAELDKTATRLRDELATVRGKTNAQTKYVEIFPSNIPAITQLVSRTESRLTVVTDYCAYGHFSAPASYRDYKAALIALREQGKDVELHIYDDTTADKMTASPIMTVFQACAGSATRV